LLWRNFFAGQSKESIGSANEARKVRPDWRPTYETQNFDEAERAVRRMGKLTKPEGDALGPMMEFNPHWNNRLAQLIERARQQCL